MPYSQFWISLTSPGPFLLQRYLGGEPSQLAVSSKVPYAVLLFHVSERQAALRCPVSCPNIHRGPRNWISGLKAGVLSNSLQTLRVYMSVGSKGGQQGSKTLPAGSESKQGQTKQPLFSTVDQHVLRTLAEAWRS